jgi:hypothetical protein
MIETFGVVSDSQPSSWSQIQNSITQRKLHQLANAFQNFRINPPNLHNARTNIFVTPRHLSNTIQVPNYTHYTRIYSFVF